MAIAVDNLADAESLTAIEKEEEAEDEEEVEEAEDEQRKTRKRRRRRKRRRKRDLDELSVDKEEQAIDKGALDTMGQHMNHAPFIPM